MTRTTGCLSGPGVAGPRARPDGYLATIVERAVRYVCALGQSVDRMQVDPWGSR